MNTTTSTPGVSTATPTPPTVYGQVTVDGLNYIERPQLFVADVVVSTPNQVLTNQRLTLPGVADFLCKGLSHEITQPGPPACPYSVDRLFRFRIVNSEGTTWCFSGALGIFDDRVFAPLCLGSGLFPFPLIPPVPVHANGSLIYELEDSPISPGGHDPYPYIVHLGFHGVYLIPVTGSGRGQGPLAFPASSGGPTAGVIGG